MTWAIGIQYLTIYFYDELFLKKQFNLVIFVVDE